MGIFGKGIGVTAAIVSIAAVLGFSNGSFRVSGFIERLDKLLGKQEVIETRKPERQDNSSQAVTGSIFDDELKVNFLDVGQGDCSVIELPNGEIMMIDAGENGKEKLIFNFLDSISAKKIDYLIATHPHSDHIGGMEEVISAYDIGNIYMPDVMHTTKTFKNMLYEIDKKGMSINKAVSEKVIFDYGNLKAEFIYPEDRKYDDLNNYSAVVKLRYLDKSFLFCGDIEYEAEGYIINSGMDFDCDVLKVAHHGSSTSSGDLFLKVASPEISVISCGIDNSYGHPHEEALNKIEKYSDKVLRTDMNGTVTVRTNGKTLSVQNER